MKTSGILVILTGILGFVAGFTFELSIPISISFMVSATLSILSAMMCYLHGN